MGEQNGNVVELVDGIICYTQAGNQTRDHAIPTVQTLLLLAKGLDEIKVLADYSKSGKVGEETIQSGLYAMKSLDFNKVAIVGASPDLVKLINSLARASGKSKVIRFFENREEAFEWLKQKVSSRSGALKQTIREK